jgi:glucose-1-phosphate adenylyltransferase
MLDIDRAAIREPTVPGAATKSALALILAGGRGSRLEQLTDWRAKPSVPFGGKFRIVDFTLSNCVNSGIRRVGVCTQYKAQSLIRHVQRGWSFLDGRFDEFVELLPAQQRIVPSWYKGTADAVYQNIDILRRLAPRHVLILAGDHVYKMNYGVMLDEHIARNAQMSVACIDVPLDAARSLGVVTIDDQRRIVDFQEKPAEPVAHPDRPDRALASMGIYVFDAPFLYDELQRDAEDPASIHDFGRDIIPSLVRRGLSVYAHDFATSCVNMNADVPYWRDVGTIDAYWDANIDLTDVIPDLNLYDATWPIWTYQEQLPPAKFVYDQDERRGIATNSLVSGGCIISGSKVHRSLLFSNVHVHSYCNIEESVVLPNVDIGRNVVLKRTVVDKYCRLPAGLTVGVDPKQDRERFYVSPRGITLITPDMLGQHIHHRR